MICQGCGKDKDLIKAHIIPQSFFMGLRDGDKPLKLITDKIGHYPQRSQTGIYDSKILCRDCEDVFQDIDHYAQSILLKDEKNHKQIIQNNKIIGFTVSNVNFTLLKKFFLSVLWRASISTSEFYSKIKLGVHTDIIKAKVWGDDDINDDIYDCVISKFIDNKLGRAMLDPHMERWSGVNYARFYMYGYIVYIKIDKRPNPKLFQSITMQEGKELLIVGRDLLKSKEYPLLHKIARQAQR